jgi:hypothetical protein
VRSATAHDGLGRSPAAVSSAVCVFRSFLCYASALTGFMSLFFHAWYSSAHWRDMVIVLVVSSALLQSGARLATDGWWLHGSSGYEQFHRICYCDHGRGTPKNVSGVASRLIEPCSVVFSRSMDETPTLFTQLSLGRWFSLFV